MAVAETARLIASIELRDNLSKGVSSAIAGVGRLESKVGGLQGRLGSLSSNLRGGFSRSLSTFSSRIKGVATAGLALFGVGGLFSIGAAIRSSLDEARQFGDEVFRLQRVTGLSATATSQLADALGDFRVDADTALRVAGLFEKNVSALGGTQKKAAKFQKTYGLALVDNKGHQLDFNEQLLNSAEFFTNKAIPASTKAAALAKLYGRNWQALIPILAQGRAGLQKTLDTSLKLSEKDLAAIEANRIATIKWDDAIGDLKVKIGIGLLPTITELVTTLTSWVDTHGPQIQQFFRDGVQAARSVASGVVGIVGSIKSVWDSVPEPVRDLLVKGVVAERTIKFLFGISVTDVAKDLFSGLGKGVFGQFLGRGSPANPMWVQSVGGVGGSSNVPGVVPTGGLSLLSKVFLVGEAIGLVLAVKSVADAVGAGSLAQARDIHQTLTDSLAGPQTADQLKIKLDAIDTGLDRLPRDPIGKAIFQSSIDELQAMRADVVAAINALPANLQARDMSGWRSDPKETPKAPTPFNAADFAAKLGKAQVDAAVRAEAIWAHGNFRWKPSSSVQIEDRRSNNTDQTIAINRVQQVASTKLAILERKMNETKAGVVAATKTEQSAIVQRVGSAGSGIERAIGAISRAVPIVSVSVRVDRYGNATYQTGTTMSRVTTGVGSAELQRRTG